MSNLVQRDNGAEEQQQQRLKQWLNNPACLAKITEVTKNAAKSGDLVRLALMASSRSPKLLVCSPESILRSLLDAEQLGIRPGGFMGRGFLVPRWNKNTKTQECHFDPGWRGLLDVAYRSGVVKKAESQVVYAKDHFRVWRDPFTRIEHEPHDVREDAGEIVAAYLALRLSSGEDFVELLRRSDIEKIRAASQAEWGPWVDWEEEMIRKSVTRRGLKYAPFDDGLEQALAVSDAADTGQRMHAEPLSIPTLNETPADRQARQTKTLAERVSGRSAREAVVQPEHELEPDPMPVRDEPAQELSDAQRRAAVATPAADQAMESKAAPPPAEKPKRAAKPKAPEPAPAAAAPPLEQPAQATPATSTPAPATGVSAGAEEQQRRRSMVKQAVTDGLLSMQEATAAGAYAILLQKAPEGWFRQFNAPATDANANG